MAAHIYTISCAHSEWSIPADAGWEEAKGVSHIDPTCAGDNIKMVTLSQGFYYLGFPLVWFGD